MSYINTLLWILPWKHSAGANAGAKHKLPDLPLNKQKHVHT